MTTILRDVQEDWIAGLRTAFTTNRRVCGVASTGFGKTFAFAFITSSAASKGKRVYIIAHRYEIVDQISRALDSFGVRHGRIQSGHRETNDLVQVAMVATLAKRLDRVPEPDLLVIDECHHSVSGTYEEIASHWLKTLILGVTATPERLDGRGLGEAFDVMVEAPPMAELIKAGYLANYKYLAPPSQVDLSSVKTRLGDYAIDELAAAMDKATITGSAVAHYAEHMSGKPAIAFAVSVAHAEHVAEEFRKAGWKAASVDGTMERAKRRDLIASIGDGRLNVLTSCALISEGVDIPVVAGAILLRPTKSLAFFLQAIGRVLRPKPDGSLAIILDHTGAVHNFGLPDMRRIWSLTSKRRKKTEAEPVATCEQCYRVFPVYPGWKAEANCNGEPDRPVGCILNAPATARDLPEEVEGKLVAVTAMPAPQAPAWTNGIDIKAATGPQWKALLRSADTREKLKHIADVRGYKPGWVQFILKEREGWKQKRNAEREEIAFTVPDAVPVEIRATPQKTYAPSSDPIDDILAA